MGIPQQKEYWDINRLRPWEKNPRAIKEEDFIRLKKQIHELGEYKPLVITPDGLVLGGNMRLRALKDLAFDKVWVSIVEPKDEKEMIQYALSDNDRAGYYVEVELAELLLTSNIPQDFFKDYKVDLGHTVDLADFISQYSPLEEDEFDTTSEYEKIQTPESKVGEVYQLGRHRLFCGDSTVPENIGLLMGEERADMIFTDPPYNVDYDYSKYTDGRKMKWDKIFNDNKSDKDFYSFLRLSFENLYTYSKDSASFYIWHADKTARLFWQALEDTKWYVSQRITWVKDRFVLAMGQHYHRMFEPCLHGWKKGKAAYFNKKISAWGDVWNLTKEDILEELDLWRQNRDSKYDHPTQKPVKLAEKGIKKSSKMGAIVLDIFGGSGSTLIACEQLNRKCYMAELDPKYCDVIRKRFSKFIGKEEQWLTETPVSQK